MKYSGGSNNKRNSIFINNFIGYNCMDDPSNLKPGYLVSGSQNIDISRSRGGLPKVRGRNALISSLGNGGIKGLHSYRHPNGDIPLFGHSTKLYKMAGATSTVTKTTTADFEDGTGTNVAYTDDKINIDDTNHVENTYAEIVAESGGWVETSALHPVVYTKTLDVAAGDFDISFRIKGGNTSNGPYYNYLRFLDEDNNVIAYWQTKCDWSDAAGVGDYVYHYFYLNNVLVYSIRDIEPSSNTTKIRKITRVGNSWKVYYDGTLVYAATSLNSKVAKLQYQRAWYFDIQNYEYHFTHLDFYSVNTNTAEWISPVYDLTTQPHSAFLKWTEGFLYDDNVVAERNMANANFTIVDGSFSIPRKLIIYTDCSATIDGVGSLELKGKNIGGSDITENITPVANTYVITTNEFATLTHATQSGWTVDAVEGTADKIRIGTYIGEPELKIYMRGSLDGIVWDDYERVIDSGDTIPRRRYIQFKFEINSENCCTNYIKDFTYTTVTSYSAAAELGTGFSGSRIRFCDYDNVCYLTDGGRPQRYDGTTLGDVGVDPPDSAPTLTASGTAGLPNGTYYGMVTFVNSYGAESNGGTASASVSPSSKKIEWTNIPTGTGDVVARKLYRTKAAGSIYFLVTTLANNAATTYTDNVADASLTVEIPTDNGIPPNCTIVYEHKNYVMYANNNTLYFSNRGEPDLVKANAYKEFPGNITGLRTYQDFLVVEGNGFSSVVVGDIWDSDYTVDNTSTKIINRDSGAVSHESMSECFGLSTSSSSTSTSNVMIFPCDYGLTYLNLGVQEQSIRSMTLSEEVQNIFENASNKENMAAVYNNFLYMVAMCYYTDADDPITVNNIIMTYDLRRRVWYPPITYGINGFCIADEMLLAGDSSVGIIYEMNSGSSDNGNNIHAIAVTSAISPQGYTTKTRFTQMRIKVDDGSVTDTVKLIPIVDGVEGEIRVGSTNSWQVNNASPFYKVPLQRGYEMQVKIEDNSTNDFTVSSINILYEGGVV